MWRFYYVILRNLYCLPAIISKMRILAKDADKYTEEERYAYAHEIINRLKRTGKIDTKVYGTELLPEDGGYIMYPNHQGKYDVYGIISGHEKPCTFVMDEAKSYTVFVKEALEMLQGKRLDKEDVRKAINVINEVAEEVKNGKRYILFPEGGYEFNNQNRLQEFKAGSFKIALKSKMPVVPVVLIDSYKAFNSYHLGKVITQVHFLEPIYYEEYKELKSKQLADLVKGRIQAKIQEITG